MAGNLLNIRIPIMRWTRTTRMATRLHHAPPSWPERPAGPRLQMESDVNKALVIVKVGDAVAELIPDHGDYDAWIRDGFGPTRLPVRVVDPRVGEALPTAPGVAGVVVTGSDAMVTDRAGWSEATARWLADVVAHGVPVLGICYGHQLLAHALGGMVIYHPAGKEIGTVPVEQTDIARDDPLFADLPERFPAHVVHSQTVAILPPGAVILASNDFEPHHAFRVGPSAWGVQFHPEFSVAATRACIVESERSLRLSGTDPAALADAVTETPEATSLLARFARFVDDAQTPERPSDA